MTCNEKNFDCHTHCFPEGATYFVQHLHCCGNKGHDKPGVPGGTDNPIPMDLYVAKTGNDETGDGSQANPFLTIQRGVDEIAKLPLLGTRYNLHIGDGTYLENVRVEYLTFNLVGNVAKPQDVIIQGGYDSLNFKGECITLLALFSHLNVQGFTFKSFNVAEDISTSASIVVESFSDITVSNCIFYSDSEINEDIGIGISSLGQISDSTFEGPSRDVILNNNAGHLLTLGGISIVGDTVVKTSLIRCHNGGLAWLYIPITKTGTITGKQFLVFNAGRLISKTNLPKTTINGTDDRTNGAFAL
ncbi:MAG: hypothetical protein LBR56_03510 [Sporomusaceae bacterium]|jgi:hypothetical protein|nr:hypothetical protein [Sporomusaceae bacterium]